jgi:RNA polymerase sigma-70 factor (ECF subfamily)
MPAAVMSNVRGGDPGTLASLIDPLIEAAHRLAYLILGSRRAAEDRVQDSTLKACTKFSSFRGEHGQIRSWFLRIVTNECHMLRRHRWWKVIKMADHNHGPASFEKRIVLTSDLEQAIKELATRQRLALFLFVYLDLSLPDAAVVAWLSRSPAKSQIYRARSRLRLSTSLEDESTSG